MTRRRKKHRLEEIVAKLRDADAMLNAGKDLAAVVELRTKFGVSKRRACMVVDQLRSSQRFEAKPRTDEVPLVKRMLQLATATPRYGYRRIAWVAWYRKSSPVRGFPRSQPR